MPFIKTKIKTDASSSAVFSWFLAPCSVECGGGWVLLRLVLVATARKDPGFSIQTPRPFVGPRLILSLAVTLRGGAKTPPVTLSANVFTTASAASATNTITSFRFPKVSFFFLIHSFLLRHLHTLFFFYDYHTF